MSRGYVYIMANAAIPDLLKIGKTTRSVEQRACELYQTGVPAPFDVVHYVLSPDCADLEREVHLELAKHRVSPDREFFAVEPSVAIAQLDTCLEYQVSEIVDEFLPGRVACHEFLTLNLSMVEDLARDMQESVMDVSTAIGFLTAAELKPAMSRWKARMSRRNASREASSSPLTLVGGGDQ